MAPAAANLDVHIGAVHGPAHTGARLPWERRRSEDGRILANAAESLEAAAVVVDLVIADLRLAQAVHILRNEAEEIGPAIAELYEIRTSIRDIARKAAAAANRAG